MKQRIIEITFILLFSTMFILGGCAGMGNKPSVCEGIAPDDSVICQYIPNPEMLDRGLLMANYAAIKKDAYSKSAALDVLDELEEVVYNGGITYDYLVKKIVSLVGSDDTIAVLFILSPEMSKFEGNILDITPADRSMLLYHISNQKMLIGLMGN